MTSGGGVALPSSANGRVSTGLIGRKHSFRLNRVGWGAARPMARSGPVNGLVRPAGVAEDTGELQDGARARRLPIDGNGTGCWADKGNLWSLAG